MTPATTKAIVWGLLWALFLIGVLLRIRRSHKP